MVGADREPSQRVRLMKRNFCTHLVYARRWPIVGRLAYILLKALGSEIPLSVKIGSGFQLVHGGFGVVLHPACVIGNNVKIYQGVTIGRGDTFREAEQSRFEGVHIGNDVLIGPGAKILCNSGVLHVGAGTIVGANAVLLRTTGVEEVWAGVPAHLIGMRSDPKYQ